MNLLPWRKKDKTSSTLPPEIKEFYDSGKRQRKSVAWLLAFVALVVTIFLTFGAFFGGRWVYRKIAGSNKPTITVTNNQTSNSKNNNSSKESEPENKPAEPSPDQNPASNQPNPATTPSLSDDTNLPSTGPQSTLAAFIIATTAGTAFYQIRLRRKL